MEEKLPEWGWGWKVLHNDLHWVPPPLGNGHGESGCVLVAAAKGSQAETGETDSLDLSVVSVLPSAVLMSGTDASS